MQIFGLIKQSSSKIETNHDFIHDHGPGIRDQWRTIKKNFILLNLSPNFTQLQARKKWLPFGLS